MTRKKRIWYPGATYHVMSRGNRRVAIFNDAADYLYFLDYTGHLFEGRYTAQLIEDEKYFLEVSRYIHLNPVKAQMVREPLAYEYSSYGLRVVK